MGRLESFDCLGARPLWGVLPSPLRWRRLRVVRQCSLCGASFALPLHAFRAQRRRALAALARRIEAAPYALETLLEAVVVFGFFGEAEREEEAALRLALHHADEPLAARALAEWHEARGDEREALRWRAAAGSFPRVDDEELRHRAAFHFWLGDLPGARDLWTQLPQGPRDEDVLPLLLLAGALEEAGLPVDAHALLTHVFHHFPARAAAHRPSVVRLRRLERRLGQQEAAADAGRDALVGLAALVALICLAVWVDGWARSNQTLFLVNATPVAAAVRVEGHGEHLLAPRSHLALRVPERWHRVHVSLPNGEAEERAVEVRNAVIDRALRRNVFVFDVLGAGIYERLEHAEPEPRQLDHFAGRSFYVFPRADRPLQPAPERARPRGKGPRRSLDLASKTAGELLVKAQAEPALFPFVNGRGLAEAHLRAGAREPELVAAYRALCEQSCAAEAESLLERLSLRAWVEPTP